jgi:hexulose-6-phosphate isomerase
MSLSRRSLLASSAVLAGAAAVRARADTPATAASSWPMPPQPEQGLLFSCKYGMTKGKSIEERLTSAREAGMDGVDFDEAGSFTPEQVRKAASDTGVFIHGAINHGHWGKTLSSADE